MGIDHLQDHRVLLFHCTITCIYFTGILLFLNFSYSLDEIGTYKFISILSTHILAEFVKLSFTSFQSDHNVGKPETNSSKPKKTFSKTIKDSLKFILALVSVTIVYYVSIVLFGAPLLTHHEETSVLALTLTALTLVPAALHLGVDDTLALFTGSQLSANGAFVETVKLNIKTVLLGAWLGAFVLPLDWDRPWQAWPIPCVVGALLGYFVAHFITFIKITTNKLKKKSKKSASLKSC